MSDELVYIPALVFMAPGTMPCGCHKRSKLSTLEAMVSVGEQFFMVCCTCEAAVEIPPECVNPKWKKWRDDNAA